MSEFCFNRVLVFYGLMFLISDHWLGRWRRQTDKQCRYLYFKNLLVRAVYRVVKSQFSFVTFILFIYHYTTSVPTCLQSQNYLVGFGRIRARFVTRIMGPVPPPQRHNDLTCGVCEVYPRAFVKIASIIDKAVDTNSLQALNIDLYCPAVSISLLMMS